MAHVAQMSEEDCFWHFVKLRFGSVLRVTCPHCAAIDVHRYRPKQRRWTCKHCYSTFSATSGTIFHSRKLPFKTILLGITLFVSGANGASALRIHRDLNVQAKTAFVLLHKLREAMQLTHVIPQMSGVVELDGGYFGGRPRSGRVRRRPNANQAITAHVNAQLKAQSEGKRAPKMWRSQANRERLKKRRVVFTIRQHSGKKGHGAMLTFVTVLMAETAEQVRETILKMVAPGSTIRTDENAAYSWLESAGYRHETVNHQIEFSTPDGVNENQAESFFSRLRRCVLGVTLRIEPTYMADYSIEMAWREDRRRMTEGEKNSVVLGAALRQHFSKWRGYFQSKALVNSVT